jgi:phenylalanine-4-hydroxylase
MIKNEDSEVVYFETEGETALSYREKEVIGHGVSRHKKGFRSPLGKLKGINLAIENMGPRDLQAYNFYDGKPISFEFESGITVAGLNVTGIRNLRGELMLIQFTDCTVKYKNEVLFSPEMGDFDMAVGKEIVSAFAGAADYHSFNLVTHTSSSETIRPQLSEIEIELNALYKEVRTIRNSEEIDATKLQQVFKTLKQNHQTDWLLPLEIYELIEQTDSGFSEEVLRHLLNLKQQRPKVAHLIEGGLALLETKEIIN